MRHELGRFKFFLVLVPLVFLAASCNKKAPEGKFGSAAMSIGGHALSVEVAQTPEAQAQGLGGRASLGADNGMLFVFPGPGKVGFWMKDTLIPLDFIWIRDGKVVEITANVQPEPNLPDPALHIYRPAELIDSTVEVNAGWAAKNQIKVGDIVTVNINSK